MSTGASPAGGQWGQCPPDFRFCPPDFFLAPHGIFLGGKSCCHWAEKKLKFTFSVRKSLWISAKTFFFWRSPAFGRKICDFGQKNLAKTFAPLILILPPRSREAGDAPE